MRIALFSDIHGNCLALDTVLADLQREQVDQLICLGDAIQGGPQPAEVVFRLRELRCPVVLGNADAWLLTGEESGREVIPAARLQQMNDVRQWSLQQLSEEARAFIAAFRFSYEVPLGDDRTMLCFHGSPRSFDDVILPTTAEEVFAQLLGDNEADIFTGGHTHLQQLRRIGNTERLFINPGSVGLAYSHQQAAGTFHADPWAEYAIVTVQPERLAVEFRRVQIDREQLVQIYQASGRPYWAEAAAQYQAIND